LYDTKKEILNYIKSSLKMTEQQKDSNSSLVIASSEGASVPENSNKTDSNKTDPNLNISLVTKYGAASSIQVPEGWSVNGFGSLGNILVFDPNGNCGYVGQSVSIMSPAMANYANGSPVSQYKEPVAFLTDVYLPLLGNTNPKIEKVTDASGILQGAQ
jgi:hypothetical protein